MAKTKKQAVEGNKNELHEAVVALRTELNKLAMDNAKRQLKNTTSMRTKKDELARLLTQISMQKYMKKNSVSDTKSQDKKEEQK